MAARGLLRAPWFSLMAVLTLALGTTATCLTFTLVQGTLLRPLPVRDEGRLFIAQERLPSGTRTLWPIRRVEIEAVGEESRLLEDVAGVTWNDVAGGLAEDDGEMVPLAAAAVTGRFFEVLGVDAILGRRLRPVDDLPGAEPVIVLSHAMWRGRYGGSTAVIGRRLGIGPQSFRVVGVMPPDLGFPRGAEAWHTVTARQAGISNPVFREALAAELELLGRLRPGVTLAQARGELETILAKVTPLERRWQPSAPLKVAVEPLTEAIVGDVREPLLLLLAAVGLVLLIATANVANLLLLRTESRRTSLAVRAALGASPARLALQLGAEAVLLALAATAVGLVVTPMALRGVLAVLPEGLPRAEAVRFDPGVIAFGFVIAFVAAAFSLLPALALTRVDLVAHFSGARTVGASAGARRGRRTLVVAQVALAVAVVAAADLLTRSLLRLESADTGMASSRLVFLGLAGPEYEGGRHAQLLDTLVTRLEALPEVAGATPVNTRPFSGTGGWDTPAFSADGQSPEAAAANPPLNFEVVHPGYFAALGIKLERGRGFRETDSDGAPEVAVLSRDVAGTLWPGEDPIGRRIHFGAPDSDDPWRRVVGIVAPTRYRDYADPRPTVYVPARQFFVSATQLVVRSALPAGAVAARVRTVVQDLDPAIRVTRVAPFGELLAAPLARPRFNALLSGLFAIAALLLATGGLYAVVSSWVRQRYPELALRVALGATRGHLRRLVLREGLGLAGLGALLGATAALASSRAFEALVFGASGLDLWSPAVAGAALVAVSLLACLPSTRLAARLDVVSVLRRP